MRVLLRVATFAGLAAVAMSCSSNARVAAPPPNAELEASLTAVAATKVCQVECDTLEVYIQDVLVAHDGPVSRTEPMSRGTRLALERELGDVEFVDLEEVDALFDPDALVADGRGVLIIVGPLERLAPDVVGIDVIVTTARDGAYGETVQYLWRNGAWHHTTSEDTGVTVTSVVS